MNTKKIFTSIVAVAFLMVGLAIADPAYAVLRHYEADVTKLISTKTTPSKIFNTVTYRVLAVGTNTDETIYSDQARTAMTNPVTAAVYATKDKIDFWCDPTDATNDLAVDIIVTDTNGGFSAVINNFTPSIRLVEVDERPNMEHTGIIWFSSPSGATNWDTGVTFLPLTKVSDVMVQIVTAESGKVLFIGTSADSDYYRASVLCTTTGFVQDTGVITNGTNVDYVPATTYGTGLTTAITGSDSTGAAGGNSRKPAFLTASDSTATLHYSGNSSTGAGFIYYLFNKMR